MKSSFLRTLETQIILGFSGKINLMNPDRGQLLGCALLFEGSLINVKYRGCSGVKAFYNAYIESLNIDFKLIVEPEIIELRDREIKRKFSFLKSKLPEIVVQHELTKKNKPPSCVLLRVNPSFLSGNIHLSSDEFNVLCTIVDESVVEDIYKKNSLLDFQITNALIGLRQKKAIKVAAQKVNLYEEPNS